MKFLLFLLCGAVACAAPVKKPSAPVASKPAAPSQSAISSAVKYAVESHVGKYKIGGPVAGVSATVEEVRPMTGWTGRYSVTGKVVITTKDGHGNYKSTRTFSATVETEGTSIKVTDVSV